mgnify:CR=1 FL=1
MISRQTRIKNYSDLFNYVKNVKKRFNRELDTSKMVDNIVFRWFSQGGVNGLDICYKKFNKKLEEENSIGVKLEEGMIKAEWE